MVSIRKGPALWLLVHICVASAASTARPAVSSATGGAWKIPAVTLCTAKTEAAKAVRSAISASRDFFIGATAGGIASFLVFPIDLAKTRMQDQVVVAGTTPKYTNMFQTLGKVAQKEGFRGLYSGVFPVMIGTAPSSALQLGCNNQAKDIFAKKLGVDVSDLPLKFEVLAGALGGMCQVAAANPMESVKVLKQVQGHKAGSTFTIVRRIGWDGLYQGWGACMLRDIPFSAIYFPVYARTKKWLLQRNGGAPGRPRKETLLDSLVAGLVAGVPAAGLTTPADVIKTRMQASMLKPASNAPRTIIGASRALWAEGGVPAFFRGLTPRVGRVAPQLAITLVVFDGIRQFLAAQEAAKAAATKPQKALKKK